VTWGRYAKSRSETQLRGDNGTAVHGLMGYLSFDDSTTYLDKCSPVEYATDGGVVDPCGLVRVSPPILVHAHCTLQG